MSTQGSREVSRGVAVAWLIEMTLGGAVHCQVCLTQDPAMAERFRNRRTPDGYTFAVTPLVPGCDSP